MSEAIDITSIGRSHGRLTGPIFLRAVDQLHLLEFHSARSKDWPVNRHEPRARGAAALTPDMSGFGRLPTQLACISVLVR
jgi:hypothetical protein